MWPLPRKFSCLFLYLPQMFSLLVGHLEFVQLDYSVWKIDFISTINLHYNVNLHLSCLMSNRKHFKLYCKRGFRKCSIMVLNGNLSIHWQGFISLWYRKILVIKILGGLLIWGRQNLWQSYEDGNRVTKPLTKITTKILLVRKHKLIVFYVEN